MDPLLPRKKIMSDMVPVKKTVAPRQVLKVAQESTQTHSREEVHEDHAKEEVVHKDVTKKRGCFLPGIIFLCIVAIIITAGGLFRGAHITLIPKKFSGPLDTLITLSRAHGENTVSVATATRTFSEERIVPKIDTVTKESFAQGTVRFYNATAKPLLIPEKTIILSSKGFKYLTNKKITIPAMTKNIPGQVDVASTAVAVGAQSNDSIDDFTFVGEQKKGITIRSLVPMSGGAQGSDSVADPALVEQARTSLVRSFSETSQLLARMSEQVPSSEIIIPVMFSDTEPTITVENNHADGVHVVAKKTVTLLLVNRLELGRSIGKLIAVPAGVQVALPSFDGLQVTTSALAIGSELPDLFQIRVTGTGHVTGVIDDQQVKTQLLGLSRKTAKKLLRNIPEIDSFSLKMIPFWRQVLPKNLKDVSVVVQK